MDGSIVVLLVVGVLAGLGGLAFFLKKGRADDVRKFDPFEQEQKQKASAGKDSPAPTTQVPVMKANTSKTAQLSALRERLAESKPGAPGAKPGLAKSSAAPAAPQPAAPVVAPPPKAPQVAAPASGGSWAPEGEGTFLVDPNWQVGAVETEDQKRARLAAEKSTKLRAEQDALHAHEIVEAELDHSLVLPEIKDQASAGLHGSAPSAPEADATDVQVKILLVDDSKVVRIKTEKLLLNAGYNVCCAVDGIDALGKLDGFSADLIITDIEMPNLDGFGLVRNIRGNSVTATVPIIVMTSHVNLHLDIAATEGINGFLPKPFNEQDMLDQVAFLTST